MIMSHEQFDRAKCEAFSAGFTVGLFPSTYFAILDENQKVVDGSNGWAIGKTELDAWARALNPFSILEIDEAKESGLFAVQLIALSGQKEGHDGNS